MKITKGNNMKARLTIGLVALAALLVSACGSNPQSLIVGKWEVSGARVGGADVPNAGAVKMTAEFSRDGTAKITMFGQTLQGTYKLDANELEWKLNGVTTKSRANVTATELELTDADNRTVIYKRK
jgi:uncharacterized protein (TIGR03066 family)